MSQGVMGQISVWLTFSIFKPWSKLQNTKEKLHQICLHHYYQRLATEYNDALLVIENNSLGIGVLSRLQESEYKNLYYSIKSTHEYVDEVAADALGGIAGFTMSMKTRPLVIAKFEEFVRNKLITVNSVRLANEIKTFVWHNGRPQAMRSYNDDLVIAACIGCWVRDTALTGRK
jgi:hypothetical protein